MSAQRLGERGRWIASAAGALAILLVIVVLARVSRVPLAPMVVPTGPAKVAIEVAPASTGDPTLQEATVMHDQRPLFLPTERNVTLPKLPLREAGGLLLDRDEQRLLFSKLTVRMPPPVNIPQPAAEAVLADAPPLPLHGLGRIDLPLPPVPARGAVVEVLWARTNRRELLEALPVSARPPTEKMWRPMEFAAAIEPAGLVGSLVVTERSDAEEVERHFRNYLAQTFRIGERLPPGFYRVVVGP